MKRIKKPIPPPVRTIQEGFSKKGTIIFLIILGCVSLIVIFGTIKGIKYIKEKDLKELKENEADIKAIANYNRERIKNWKVVVKNKNTILISTNYIAEEVIYGSYGGTEKFYIKDMEGNYWVGSYGGGTEIMNDVINIKNVNPKNFRLAFIRVDNNIILPYIAINGDSLNPGVEFKITEEKK